MKSHKPLFQIKVTERWGAVYSEIIPQRRILPTVNGNYLISLPYMVFKTNYIINDGKYSFECLSVIGTRDNKSIYNIPYKNLPDLYYFDFPNVEFGRYICFDGNTRHLYNKSLDEIVDGSIDLFYTTSFAPTSLANDILWWYQSLTKLDKKYVVSPTLSKFSFEKSSNIMDLR
jgi:hypothetical protein